MPYFDELNYKTGDRKTVYRGATQSYPQYEELVYQRGYRSNIPDAVWSRSVLDGVADPYAGWLASTMERRMVQHGAQNFKIDRGHTWWYEKHTASGAIPRLSLRAAKGYDPSIFDIDYYGFYPVVSHSQAQPALPLWGGTGFDHMPSWSDDLAAFGQQAYSRRKPSPSTFEASQFLGELREGLPKLAGAALIKGRVKDVMKNAGGEYLNIQFGWAPMVSELQSLVKTLLSVDQLLRQKRKEQGTPRKATVSMPPERYSDTQITSSLKDLVLGSKIVRGDGTFPMPSGVRSQLTLDPTTSVTGVIRSSNSYLLRSTERRRRFEGVFTSFFDYPDVDASWPIKAASLLNLRLTPEVLWELAPWSWLVDWVFKIQATIESNSSASDQRVVLNYGYVTEQVDAKLVFSGDLVPASTQQVFAGTSRVPFSVVFADSYKRRIRANPFGFQISSPTALNGQQLAILAALGLSKA